MKENLKRQAVVLAMVAAGVVAAYSSSKLHQWRQAEEESRVRGTHTPSGTVKQPSPGPGQIDG